MAPCGHCVDQRHKPAADAGGLTPIASTAPGLRAALTHSEPFLADLSVDNGAIAANGPGLPPEREEVDAQGCFVTPGYLDIHTRCDGQLIWSDSRAIMRRCSA
jgi:imidazolonepropionase-like amidohydrolase